MEKITIIVAFSLGPQTHGVILKYAILPHMNLDPQKLKDEQSAIETFLANPNAYQSSDFPDKTRRLSELNEILKLIHIQQTLKRDIEESNNLLQDPEYQLLAEETIRENEQKLMDIDQKLLELTIPKDPLDTKNAIVEVRAGAGGDEASLFAGELLKMYLRYAETHGFKAELMNENINDAGGYKEVIFLVKGKDAYGQLKFEAGVHRVQRVPVTESQGRVHTSTVTVAVLPEAEEQDLEIKPEDLKIDIYRSGGHGGQSVNTTDSAVRITHLPTGIVISMQDERSQLQNKAKAMNVLRSRLLEKKREDEQRQASDRRKSLIGTGDRSEKIRTYNFPQDRITDHRIHYSRSGLPAALNGQIDDLIDKLHQAELELVSQSTN